MKEPNRRRKIIEEICQEKGIEKIDISYDWISILKKGNIEKKLVNHNFYLNTKVSTNLARDKYSTYELLKFYHIPIIEHKVLFNEAMIPDVKEINQEYQCLKNCEKQVIKANDSSEGRDVFVCCDQVKKIEIVEKLFEKEIEAVVVCPYEEIEYEYRTIFLYGEVIYIYKKCKPFVVGDGKLKVKELINQQLKYLIEPKEDVKLEQIPAKGEKVVVGWKHNLSNGGIPMLVDAEDRYGEVVKRIALKVGEVMDLSFASIDICVTKDKKVCVMEVNSEVCISKFCDLAPDGYEIGKRIYAKVIDKMFESE